MASLESFVPNGGTVSRVAAQQVIQISGALLQVTGRLDAGTVPPGWRIDCYSGGGLAFNLPDAAARDISIASRSGASLTLSAADWGAIVDGDALEKDGDLGDLDNGTVYYAERAASPVIHLHATLAAALAGQSATRVSAGTGAVPGGDGGLALAAGPRTIGRIGDADGPEVHILERADAHVFRGDNYNSASEICRFQAGRVTLENFYWESLRPNGSVNINRSDFDVAPGAEPILRRGEISTLAQFNHLASSLVRLEDVRFRNRTAAEGAWAFEVTAAFATPPTGLSILPAGRAVSVLGAFLTDGVPLKLGDLAGLYTGPQSSDVGGIEIGPFNPNGVTLTDAQVNAKIIWLVDPAGTPTKRTARGQIEIRRAVELDFGTEAAGTGGSCRLIPTDESPPYTADIVDQGAGPHLFPEVLQKRAAGGAVAYADWENYRWLKVSPSYRKATGTLAVATQSEAGRTQTVAAALTREIWPDGTAFALSASAPSAAADLEGLYEIIKRHELANPKDGGTGASLAVIDADGYIALGADFSLVLSSTATDLSAWNAATETLTVKASAAVAAGSRGVPGIAASGTGAITTAGTVDTAGILLKTASAQNTILTAVPPAGRGAASKMALYGATGARIGAVASVSGSTASVEFRATAAQSAAGCRLVWYQPGFDPQVIALDLSAGGRVSAAFARAAKIAQLDGADSYDSESVSSVSSVAFDTTDLAAPLATLEVANEALSAIAAFSTFAAPTTAAAMKFYAFGGVPPRPLASFTGDQLSVPPSARIRRKASADVNATVNASVIAQSGATILDASNGSVQFVGGVSLSQIQNALLRDFDIDEEAVGTQSVAAQLLRAAKAGVENKATLAALPGQILGSATSAGGDTVKQALARVSGLPSASAVRTELLGHALTAGEDVETALKVLLAVAAGTVAVSGDTYIFSDSDGAERLRGDVADSGARTSVSVAS